MLPVCRESTAVDTWFRAASVDKLRGRISIVYEDIFSPLNTTNPATISGNDSFAFDECVTSRIARMAIQTSSENVPRQLSQLFREQAGRANYTTLAPKYLDEPLYLKLFPIFDALHHGDSLHI